MSAATPPPELPGGQETEPPDVRLAVRAAVKLLNDLADRRLLRKDDRLRIAALLAALRRLRKHLEEDQ